MCKYKKYEMSNDKYGRRSDLNTTAANDGWLVYMADGKLPFCDDFCLIAQHILVTKIAESAACDICNESMAPHTSNFRGRRTCLNRMNALC